MEGSKLFRKDFFIGQGTFPESGDTCLVFLPCFSSGFLLAGTRRPLLHAVQEWFRVVAPAQGFTLLHATRWGFTPPHDSPVRRMAARPAASRAAAGGERVGRQTGGSRFVRAAAKHAAARPPPRRRPAAAAAGGAGRHRGGGRRRAAGGRRQNGRGGRDAPLRLLESLRHRGGAGGAQGGGARGRHAAPAAPSPPLRPSRAFPRCLSLCSPSFRPRGFSAEEDA